VQAASAEGSAGKEERKEGVSEVSQSYPIRAPFQSLEVSRTLLPKMEKKKREAMRRTKERSLNKTKAKQRRRMGEAVIPNTRAFPISKLSLTLLPKNKA
jgi:hypothetical protein